MGGADYCGHGEDGVDHHHGDHHDGDDRDRDDHDGDDHDGDHHDGDDHNSDHHDGDHHNGDQPDGDSFEKVLGEESFTTTAVDLVTISSTAGGEKFVLSNKYKFK